MFRNLFHRKTVKAAVSPRVEELCAEAGSAYQSKDYRRVVELCDGVIALKPDHAEAHYKRGNALKDLGQFAAALLSYDQAIECNPKFAHAWCNRGVVQQSLAAYDTALASYDRAIVLDPADAVAHSNRGSLLQAMLRWDAALASYDQALAFSPTSFHVWFQRGNVLRELQRSDAAMSSYREAIKLKPDYAEAHYNCGVLLERAGQPRSALANYEEATALYPEFYQAQYNRAGVLRVLGDKEAALVAYDQAIAANSDYFEAHGNRGVVLQELGRRDAALASYDRAISIRPDHAEAHFNRGSLLTAMTRWDAALANYDRVIALKPDYAAAHCERARVLLQLKRLEEALSSFDRATEFQPDFPIALYNKSLALLLKGDYAAGWRLYEWRWKNADILSMNEARIFSQPLWLGEESIAGKRLLVHCEQGLGDTLQFCRFAKTAHDLGAIVMLEVQASLVGLLASVEGVSQIVAHGGALPVFDYHCPLMSLPLALKTAINTIPSASRYLRSDATKIAQWQTRLGKQDRPRVGLTWSGNPNQGHDQDRSTKLADWIEHLPTGFQYICLQKEIRPADLETLEANPWIYRFDAELHDFSDTAALCECVDLVISVCTSVAHLSAALGRPTWILLAFVPDWRWLLDREDSPWYPTVKLYRQPAIGDWKSVFARVGADLGNFANAPEHERPNVLMSLAAAAASQGECEKAIELYGKVIDLEPDNATAYYKRGNLLKDRSQLEGALADYDRAIVLNPRYAYAFCNRGVVLGDLKRFGAALDSYEQAIALSPEDAIAYFNRGAALREMKRPQEALASYDHAIVLRPQDAESHYNRALLLTELKQWDAALAGLDAAIAIRPHFAEAFLHRANTRSELKRYESALEDFDRAIALKPDYADALHNRGNTLFVVKQFTMALASFDKAIELKPRFATAYAGRGLCLQNLRKHEEAIASYRKALEVDPDQRYLLGMRRHAQMQICDWDDLPDDLDQLENGLEARRAVSTPHAMLALVDSTRLHRLAAEAWVREECPPDDSLGAIPRREHHNKIRIGYFSADFREHAVSLLTAGLFETHDRSRFEITAFAYGRDANDAMSRRLERAFDRFIDVRGWSDFDVALRAREFEIDIAVDLGGFTEDARTKIFALRSAPMQIGYLGYLGTMGAPYMDYLVADSAIIPDSHRREYSEKIIYLPSYQANDARGRITERTFSRGELGLPPTGFVFCCFNANYKIMPASFAAWMRILERVDGSSLLLLVDSQLAQDNLVKAARRWGVDPRRIIFGKRLVQADYLARFRAMDLFLDTLPYNAGTTASDALWAGLPVLTCSGEAFPGRVAASVLRAIDLSEMITTSLDQYEDLAVRLATDPRLMTGIRQKLSNNRMVAPLFDTPLFTKTLEYAYTQIYDRYHRALSPEDVFPES